MTSSIKQLLALGPIPSDSEMSDELFEKYDKLLNFSQPLSYDDAAQLTGLFSPDCDTQGDRGSLRYLRGASVPRR